jgi:hypothetical protein
MRKMSEQVVIGRMLDSKRIKTKQTTIQIADWQKRAMWSYLRLQYGRSIDKEIRERRDAWILEKYGVETKQANRSILKRAMEKVFGDILSEKPVKPRTIQFIMDEDVVIAVASLQHLLVPPVEVYDMAAKIMESKYGLQPLEVSELKGLIYQQKEVAGFKLGMQVYGGDITTRQAISLSSFLRVELCLNPLSWLGIGGFGGFLGRGRDYERVLRIKVKAELEPRLQSGIDLMLKKTKDLEDRVEASQRVKVKRSDAEIIMAAFGLSYSLGAKSLEQILERLDHEAKTQWGMSMAASWVSAHGKFKETPEKQERAVEQKLSTIAGAALLIDDIKDVKEKSLEWLRTHVQEGEIKSIDELISRLGIGKVKK